MKNKYWSVFLLLKSGWQRSDSPPSSIFKISKSSGNPCTAPVNPAICSTPFSRAPLRSSLAGYNYTLHLCKKACVIPDPGCSSSRSAASFVSPDTNLETPASKDKFALISASFSSGQRISEDSNDAKISSSLLPLRWKRLLPSSGPGHPFADGLWPPAWSRLCFLPPSTPYFSLPLLDNPIGALSHNFLKFVYVKR